MRATLNRGSGIFTRNALIERAVSSHNLLGVSGSGTAHSLGGNRIDAVAF